MSKKIKSKNRRLFLTQTAAYGATLAFPKLAQAGNIDAFTLLRLHPVRFVAGLVYDTARSVIVDVASKYIVDKLKEKHYSPEEANKYFSSSIRYCQGLCSGENTRSIQYVPYKASIVTLGISEYQPHIKREIIIELADELQISRYNIILDYLRDEKIPVKLPQWENVKILGADIEPDDMLNIERWTMSEYQENHYYNLIGATRTSSFQDWSV